MLTRCLNQKTPLKEVSHIQKVTMNTTLLQARMHHAIRGKPRNSHTCFWVQMKRPFVIQKKYILILRWWIFNFLEFLTPLSLIFNFEHILRTDFANIYIYVII